MHHRRLPALLLLISSACCGLAVFAQITSPGFPQPSPKLPRIIKLLQAKLDASRRIANFPGAQVGFVFVDGQTPERLPRYLSGSVASGVADLQTKTPLKITDRLLAGSIGKTFVSALTLLLVQEGKLNLDDKIKSSWGMKRGLRNYRTPNIEVFIPIYNKDRSATKLGKALPQICGVNAKTCCKVGTQIGTQKCAEGAVEAVDAVHAVQIFPRKISAC